MPRTKVLWRRVEVGERRLGMCNGIRGGARIGCVRHATHGAGKSAVAFAQRVRPRGFEPSKSKAKVMAKVRFRDSLSSVLGEPSLLEIGR